MKRRSTLTVHSRRLTPAEVAQLWFRRGADFTDSIHSEHPDFPQAGPDGLYLLSQVEAWFARWHRAGPVQTTSLDHEEDEAMRVAGGGRG